MTYVIQLNSKFPEACSLAVFLQGLVNRKEKRIYLDFENYLDYLTEDYVRISLEDAIMLFKDEITGLVIYDHDEADVSINMAASICAVNSFLGVPRCLYSQMVFQNFPVYMDLATIKGSNASRQRYIFHKYQDQFKRDGLIHQVVTPGNFHFQLRDFGISRSWFTFFTDESEEDLAFRQEVLNWLDRNTPIYGWNTDEIAFVRDISVYGCFIIPMDWSLNHSFLDTKQSVKLKQRFKDELLIPENKHFLAIVVSDGDNVQWLERDFMTTSNYGQRLKSENKYKMTWTVAPLLTTLSPAVLKYIYQQANHDYFISGVSGMGYMNILEYPFEKLDKYASDTAKLFENADIQTICMLDNVKNTLNVEEVTKRLDCFAKHSNIKGGIWELDPNRYESGKGSVFWSSNGKPFVSVRLSLWHPSNQPSEVNEKWLLEYAEKINQSPINPYSIEGYTVLNVHPWTTNMNDLNFLVSKLNDYVKIVSAGELIDLVTKHVPRENKILK